MQPIYVVVSIGYTAYVGYIKMKGIMMSQIPSTTVRIDPLLKEEANVVLDQLGISMSAAINAFLKALVREQGLPFDMRVGGKTGADS